MVLVLLPVIASQSGAGASAGPLFQDGFESGNFSAWSAVNTGADGSATVQTATVKTGSRAARLSATATTGSNAYARKTFSTSFTNLTASGDFQVLVEGAAGSNVPLLRLYDQAGVRLVSLYRQNQSSNTIAVQHSGSYFSTTGKLPLNTWGRFDLRVVAAGTGVSTIEVRLNGTLVYQTGSASLGAGGVRTIQIGNEISRQTFTLVADDIVVTDDSADTTPPNTTIDSGPSGGVASATATFTFSSSEPGSSFGCSLDSAPFAACTSPASFNGLGEGAHTFAVRATDSSGNVDPTPASRGWTVDTVAPQTTINSGPSGTVTSSSATLTFSASEAGSTFMCSLDSAVFAACTSPKDYTGLASGAHTFEVRAIDSVGNSDPSPAARQWTVETAPVLVGAGDIAGCNNPGDEATAALLDSIPGTVFTTGDNVYPNGTASEYTNCYNPSWGRHKARTRPAPGNHDYGTPGASGYFNYFGTAAGDPTKGYYSYELGSWHVVVLNSNCAEIGGCGAGSPQETWLRNDLASSSAGCTVGYMHHPRFSSGTHHGSNPSMAPLWAALYAHGAELVLAGHEHNYERFAPQDPAGNSDSAYGIREFVVGSGGFSHYPLGVPLPNSEVRNGDTSGVLKLTLRTTGYDWQFVPEAGKTFSDSGSGSCHGAPPPPPAGNIAFSDGFESGNLSAWTLVKTGGGGTAVVQNSVVKAGSYAARLSATSASGSMAYARKSFSARTEVTAAGDFRIQTEGASGGNVPLLRLYDTAGTRLISLYRQNQSSDRISIQHSGAYWTTTGRLPLNTWGRFDAHVITAGTGASTVEVRQNGNTIYSTTTASLGTSGVATLQIGNETQSQAFTLVADDILLAGAAPETTIDSGPSGTTTSTSASFTFSSSDSTAAFECSLDAAVFAPCDPPKNDNGLAQGVHEFRVRARDNAGNIDPTPAVRSWTVDNSAPETTIDSGPSGSAPDGMATFTFSSSEAGSRFECALDGAPFTTCTSPKSYSGLADGGHSFRVRAIDAADHVDPSPADRSWSVGCDPAAALPSNGDPGALVLADNFEGNLSEWTKIAAEGDATAQIQRQSFRSGACALRLHVTSNVWDSRANVAKTLPTGATEAWATGWFNTEREAGDQNWNTPTFRFYSNGKRILDVSRQNVTGNLFVRYPDRFGDWTYLQTGRRLDLNRWYNVKVHAVANGGLSTIEVWLDGTKVLTTGSATFDVWQLDVVMVGAEHQNQDGDVVADDVVIKAVVPPPTNDVFTDGFESGTLQAWNAVKVGGDGVAEAQAGVVESGGYAARLSATATSGSLAYLRQNLLAAHADFTASADVRVLTEGALNGTIPLLTFYDAGGAKLASVFRHNQNGGKLSVEHSGSTALITGTLPLDTWANVKLRAVARGNGASIVEVWLNGTLVYQTETVSLGTGGTKALQIGNSTAAKAYVLAVDNVVATKGSQGLQNDPRYKLLIADMMNKRLLITDFDGRVVWKFDNPTGRSEYSAGPIGVRWMPGEQILATFGTGEVGLIDVATKTWVWKVTGYNGEFFESPYDAELLPDGNLAVATRWNQGGRITVYDRSTGAIVWKYFLSNAHSVHYRTPAQSYNTNDPTLLVTGWGAVREVSYRPGGSQTVTWQATAEYPHDAIVLPDDTVLTTEGYYIQKINRTGTQLWKRMTPDENRRIAVNPNPAGGFVYTVGESDRIEFRDSNGQALRTWSMLSDGTGLDYPYGLQIIDFPG